MNRRNCLRVLLASGAAFSLSACDRMPDAAVAPWGGPGPQEGDARLRALAWALLAPNPHNLQSWLADLREPGVVHLRVDRKRLLPETDPPNRQILIGCGAFLELLQQAAAQDGWQASIAPLPEGAYAAEGVDERPFATVRFARPTAGEAPPARDPLFAFVQARHTVREPYLADLPDAAVLAKLRTATERPGIRLHLADTARDADRVARIAALATEGCRIEFSHPPTWQESVDVMRVGAESVAREPSGLALLGTDIWWARQFGLLDRAHLVATDGMAARYAIEGGAKAAQATPVWAWLESADNSRAAQLEAGRAFMRLALAATGAGLVLQPNSQVLQEFAAMAGPFAAIHQLLGVAAPARIQMLVRLGRVDKPAGPAPRRKVEAIVRA